MIDEVKDFPGASLVGMDPMEAVKPVPEGLIFTPGVERVAVVFPSFSTV